MKKLAKRPRCEQTVKSPRGFRRQCKCRATLGSAYCARHLAWRKAEGYQV